MQTGRSRISGLLFRLDPVLLLILAVGAIVRFWGIDFGLPLTNCRPDEVVVVDPAFGFFSGDLNPHFFHYGTLFSYLCFCGDALYYFAGSLSGRFAAFDDFVREYQVDPSRFYLIARLLSATFGVATIPIIYRLGLRLFDRSIALASALFLALAHLHVRDSHFGLTDVPHAFFLSCGTLWIVRCGQDKEGRSYLLAGLFCGLATSTKYAAAMLVVPFCLVHAFNVRDGGQGLAGFFDRRALLFFSAAALAFLAGTPYALFAFGEFWPDLFYEAEHLWAGHAVNLGRGWWWHLKFSLYYGIGWSLLAAALAGTLLLFLRWPRKAAALLGFALVYYAVAGSGETVFVRYSIAFLPGLCVAAAWLVISVARKIVRRPGSRAEHCAAAALCVLVILPSLQRVIGVDRLLASTDNRLIARSWILSHLPAGSMICQTDGYSRVQLPRYRPTAPPPRSSSPAGGDDVASSDSPSWMLRAEPFQADGLPKYRECAYRTRRNQFVSGGVALAELPQYLIIARSPQSHDKIVPPELEPFLQSSYREIKSFLTADPATGPAPAPEWYDPIDAFYVPFTSFDGIERPGPDLYIYERK